MCFKHSKFILSAPHNTPNVNNPKGKDSTRARDRETTGTDSTTGITGSERGSFQHDKERESDKRRAVCRGKGFHQLCRKGEAQSQSRKGKRGTLSTEHHYSTASKVESITLSLLFLEFSPIDFARYIYWVARN